MTLRTLLSPAARGRAFFPAGFRPAFLAMLLALAPWLGAAPVKFDLPAQPLPAALQEVARLSGVQVLFPHNELKDRQAPALAGELEAAEALARLLKDSGFTAVPQGEKQYLVKRISAGSIRGVLLWPEGNAAAGVSVLVRGTGQSALTDRYGQYLISDVPAGRHLLVARAEGYQPLHVTDVSVLAGRELVLSRQTMRKASDLTKLEPFTVTAEAVTTLGDYAVTDSKAKPFAEGNMDVPRTMNDVQPYYIFDRAAIEQSGAPNIETFLKQRLTMNTTARTTSDVNSSFMGTSSSINLNGLGADQTLVLVNGRRQANASLVITEQQPNINGIPMAAIERIEILPTSAAAIYGGGAMGGVVNVILKKNYVGGEVSFTYDNAFGTDRARRTVNGLYGFNLEGGRTRVQLGFSKQDSNAMMFQDRPDITVDYMDQVFRTYPEFFQVVSAYPWQGPYANIIPSSSTQATLTLKNGQVINSRRTYVPAGTSASTPAATLYSGLAANGGSWSWGLGDYALSPNGRYMGLGFPMPFTTYNLNVSRDLLPWLEATVEFSYRDSPTESYYMSYVTATVPASAPTNPFTTAVRVSMPFADVMEFSGTNRTVTGTAALSFKLPAGWRANLDYTRSESKVTSTGVLLDQTYLENDIAAGVLNPFVDSLAYPLNLKPYLGSSSYEGNVVLDDFVLRSAGDLPALPWAEKPGASFSLEHRVNRNLSGLSSLLYPAGPSFSFSSIADYYPRKAVTDAGHLELHVPLVPKNWRPFLRGFELQLAGRHENYTVGTGTNYKTTRINVSPQTVTYTGPTLSGAPVFSDTTFRSTDYTAGLLYRPFRSVILRASTGTAFMPPNMTQLSKNLVPSTTTVNVIDRRTGVTTPVYTIGGGNPDLSPQSSRDFNAGVVWQPDAGSLQGLRLSVDYRAAKHRDYIGTLTAQNMVNNEALFPDRVIRNASGTITLVDISSINLYKREQNNWTATAEYTLKSSVGVFTPSVSTTVFRHMRRQVSLTAPMYDYADANPAEASGTGGPKYRTSGSLAWNWRGWNALWNFQYYGSYKAYGSPGSPLSVQSAAGGIYDKYIAGMGGQLRIPSQIYHDLSVSYAVNANRWWLKGVKLQVGVRNLFKAIPPLDLTSSYSGGNYASPYGPSDVQSYWLTAKKAF